MNNATTSGSVVVERYVLGRLSAAEMDEIEERLIWDAELREEVELFESLRKGLADNRHIGAPARVHSPLSRSPWIGARAASVAVLAGLAGWVGGDRFGGPRIEPMIVTGGVFYIEATRGMSSDPRDVENLVALSPTAEWATLVVFPAQLNFEDYRLQVEQVDQGAARAVLSREGLVPASDALTVTLPRELLVPGAYSIEVMGRRLEGSKEMFFEAASLSFEVQWLSE